MNRPAYIVLFAAAIISTYGSADECGTLNESYNICGQLCAPTCETPHPDPRFCPRIVCVREYTGGCRCDEGYVRDKSSGSCVLVEDCPEKK